MFSPLARGESLRKLYLILIGFFIKLALKLIHLGFLKQKFFEAFIQMQMLPLFWSKTFQIHMRSLRACFNL